MKRYRVYRYLSKKSKARIPIHDYSGWDSKARAKNHVKRLTSFFPDAKFKVVRIH